MKYGKGMENGMEDIQYGMEWNGRFWSMEWNGMEDFDWYGIWKILIPFHSIACPECSEATLIDGLQHCL